MSQDSPSLRPLFVLIGGQSVSMLGTQAVQFGLIWWLTVQTGSPTVVAGATLLALIPRALLGPLVGALVDRWDRRRIMLAADSVMAASALLLAGLFALDAVALWHVLLLLLLRGIGELFHESAMLASMSLMAPESELTRVQGVVQSIAGLLLIAAPPLGALLYAALPMPALVAVDAATALFAIVPLLVTPIPRPERTVEAAPSILAESAAGFRYLASRRGHLALLTMAATINLFMVPAFSLLPVLVHDEGAGAGRLALVSASFGIGMLAGGLLLGVWGGFDRRITTVRAGLIATGLTVLGLAASPVSTLVFPLLLATIGATTTLINGPIHAILQATVAPDFQGRIFALYGSVATLVTPIGLLLAGPIAEIAGTRTWFWTGGAVCLAVALAALVSPALAEIERTTPEDREAVEPTAERPATSV